MNGLQNDEDYSRTMHQRQCRDFITGDNRKGVACMQDNEWVVVKLEGQ